MAFEEVITWFHQGAGIDYLERIGDDRLFSWVTSFATSTSNGLNWSPIDVSWNSYLSGVRVAQNGSHFAYGRGIYELDLGQLSARQLTELSAADLVIPRGTNRLVLFGRGGAGLWVSDDVGSTWVHVQEGTYPSGLELSSGHLLTAQIRTSTDADILISSDSGQSWAPIGYPLRLSESFETLTGPLLTGGAGGGTYRFHEEDQRLELVRLSGPTDVDIDRGLGLEVWAVDDQIMVSKDHGVTRTVLATEPSFTGIRSVALTADGHILVGTKRLYRSTLPWHSMGSTALPLSDGEDGRAGVYPTPGQRSHPVALSVPWQTQAEGTVTFYDALGRAVFRGSALFRPGQPTHLTLPHLSPGLYFISVSSSGRPTQNLPWIVQ